MQPACFQGLPIQLAQLRKSCTDMPTGQPHLDNSSLRPSGQPNVDNFSPRLPAQVNLDYAKLTIKTSDHNGSTTGEGPGTGWQAGLKQGERQDLIDAETELPRLLC